jgi:hypothetical protein
MRISSRPKRAALALLRVRHVGGHREGFGAKFLRLPADLIERCPIACRHANLGAVAGESQCRGLADARRTSRDQDNLAVERMHAAIVGKWSTKGWTWRP